MATYLNLETGREERVVEESHELIPQRIDKFEVFFKAINHNTKGILISKAPI